MPRALDTGTQDSPNQTQRGSEGGFETVTAVLSLSLPADGAPASLRSMQIPTVASSQVAAGPDGAIEHTNTHMPRPQGALRGEAPTAGTRQPLCVALSAACIPMLARQPSQSKTQEAPTPAILAHSVRQLRSQLRLLVLGRYRHPRCFANVLQENRVPLCRQKRSQDPCSPDLDGWPHANTPTANAVRFVSFTSSLA